MANLSLLAIGVVAVVSVYGLTRLSGASSPSLPTDFAQVESDLRAGGLLYDVRTSAEYAAGHIERALVFPLQSMQAGVLPDIPKDQKIYLYCQSGNRSSQAAALLSQKGYTNITDLGGIHNVKRSGGKFTQ